MKYCILFILIIYACSNDEKRNSTDATILSLGKENATLCESLIDSVSIIQISGDDKLLISYIKKIIIKNDKLFISDFNLKRPVLVFDLNGNFLNKIGELGNSLPEFIMMSDFSVDENHVYIYDSNTQKLITFGHDGEYSGTIITDFRADAIQKIDSGFIFSLAKENNNGKIIVTDNQLNITNKYFSYLSTDKDDKLTDNTFQVSNNIYYNKPITNFISEFDNNGKYLREFYFDFGNKNVPDELIGNYEKLAKDRNINDYIYFYDAPFIVGDVLIGRIFNGKNKATLIYNLKTKEFIINELIQGRCDFMKIPFPLGAIDNKIIGYIDFSIYDNIINKPLLSEEQLLALNDGTIFLCIYHLKH